MNGFHCENDTGPQTQGRGLPVARRKTETRGRHCLVDVPRRERQRELFWQIPTWNKMDPSSFIDRI